MRLLELFAGAGGCTAGYMRAGFTVTAVDLNESALRRNPADGGTVVADAMAVLRGEVLDLSQFDAIHASPPCQRYSHGTVAGHAAKHPDLIGPVREQLVRIGLPYVIENVPRAPLLDPVVMCGTQFSLRAQDDDGEWLKLKRHRLFECSFPVERLECAHRLPGRWAGAYGGARRDKVEAREIRHGGYVPSARVIRELMGIDWMTEPQMFQAIPPVYARWIGWYLVDAVARRAAA